MIFLTMMFVVHFASRLSTKIISIKPTFYPLNLNTSKLFSTLKSLNKVRKNIQGVLYLVFFPESSVFCCCLKRTYYRSQQGRSEGGWVLGWGWGEGGGG
jgi:hypothetical protein